MQMQNELLIFIFFILMGMMLSFIFDIFRAIRKTKKYSDMATYVQDCIYVLIIAAAISACIIISVQNIMRGYVFIALSAGIIAYMIIFKDRMVKIILNSIENLIKFLLFIVSPLSLIYIIYKNICIFLRKIVLKCCNKIKYVVICIYNNKS